MDNTPGGLGPLKVVLVIIILYDSENPAAAMHPGFSFYGKQTALGRRTFGSCERRPFLRLG